MVGDRGYFVILGNVSLKVLKMGTIKNFEELEIWKLARELVNQIYADFNRCNDFTFKRQITGAGISVMNNISEGFCRSGDNEFKNFLNISVGSSGEVKCMYYIAEDQKYVKCEIATDRRSKCQRIINGANKLMSYLRSSQTTKPQDHKTTRPQDHKTIRPLDH